MSSAPTTLQEIFDIVVNGIRKQGGRSIKPLKELSIEEREETNYSNYCLYRGPNGRKCGIGHLILDEFYNEDCENESASSGPHVRVALRLSGITPESCSMGHDLFFNALQELQQAHDGSMSETQLENEFAKFAEKHSLKYTKQSGWWTDPPPPELSEDDKNLLGLLND